MQPSAELKSIVHQPYGKEASGGLLDFAKLLYSRQDGVFVISSEPNDRYDGYEVIMSFYEMADAASVDIRMDYTRLGSQPGKCVLDMAS